MSSLRTVAVGAVLVGLAGCSGTSNQPMAGATPAPRPAPGATSASPSGSRGASPGPSAHLAPAATGGGPSTASARPLPTRSPDPFAGNADNGETVQLKVGQQLRVRLDGAWTIPVASVPAVLKRISVKQRSRLVRVVFLAVDRGASAVTAKTTSGTPKTWRIRVVVS